MALIRTDYGLIYNTNGNLCATLLPDGGVAVTEGTTNLFPLEKSVVLRGGTTPYWYSVKSGLVQGGTYTLRAFIKVEPNDDTVNPRMTLRFIYSDGTSNTHATGSFPKDGVEYEYILTKTANPDKTLVKIDGWILDHTSVGPGGKYQSARNIQLEQKPYATPFVEGTRPAGVLSYPELAKQFNQREFTFVAEWRPYTELGIGSSILDRYFQIDNGTITAGNKIRLSRINNSPGLMLELPNADGSGSQQYSFYPNSYPANAWHFIACVLDVPNMKARIHINDEYKESHLTEVPAMLDLQRFFLGCVGTGGQLNGELKNVQIINEALPIEVINNFLNPAN